MSQTKAQLIDPVDGSLVNADINASAAIAGTKISPDFGSQNVVTTGTLGCGQITTTANIELSSADPVLAFTDTNNNDDFSIRGGGGLLKIRSDTDSADRLVIDSSGNVGIGTTSPRSLLDLGAGSGDGSLSTTLSQYQIILEAPQGSGDYGRNIGWSVGTNGLVAAINAVDVGGDDATGLTFITGNNTAASERMRIDSSGNVGIGTTSPSTNLHLHTDANGEGILIKSTGNTSNALTFDANRGTDGVIGVAYGRWNGTTVAQINFISGSDGTNKDDGHITFGTESAASSGNVNATERMRIDSSGNVGIGTAGPTYKNAVFGGSQRTLHITGTAAPQLRIESSTSGQADLFLQAGNSGSDAIIGNAGSNGDLVFSTNNGSSQGTRLRILDDGGICFNSDTAAANALDDYEEGTFSATASAAGYSGGSAISMSGESYTKIGRVVYFRMHLTVASNLSDGDLTITGLPFTAGADSVVVFAWQDAASFNNGAGIITGTQCVRFNGVFPTHSSGNATIRFSGTYNI